MDEAMKELTIGTHGQDSPVSWKQQQQQHENNSGHSWLCVMPSSPRGRRSPILSDDETRLCPIPEKSRLVSPDLSQQHRSRRSSCSSADDNLSQQSGGWRESFADDDIISQSAPTTVTTRRGGGTGCSCDCDVILPMTPEVGFREEVEIGDDFLPDEVRIMVGRHRVRIIAEHSGSRTDRVSPSNGITKDHRDFSHKESVHKVVHVPSYIDSYSLKSVFRKGRVVITGSPVHHKRKWTVGKNGHLVMHEDGSVRMTLDLPVGVATEDVSVTTLTKNYIVVSSHKGHQGEELERQAADVIDTYELPESCDVTQVRTKSLGGTTLIVEVDSIGRRRAYTY